MIRSGYHEPGHNSFYIIACAPSKDSDQTAQIQTAHLHSLIRVFTVRSMESKNPTLLHAPHIMFFLRVFIEIKHTNASHLSDLSFYTAVIETLIIRGNIASPGSFDVICWSYDLLQQRTQSLLTTRFFRVDLICFS